MDGIQFPLVNYDSTYDDSSKSDDDAENKVHSNSMKLVEKQDNIIQSDEKERKWEMINNESITTTHRGNRHVSSDGKIISGASPWPEYMFARKFDYTSLQSNKFASSIGISNTKFDYTSLQSNKFASSIGISNTKFEETSKQTNIAGSSIGISKTNAQREIAIKALESKRIKPNIEKRVTFVGVSSLRSNLVDLGEPITKEEIQIWEFLFNKYEKEYQRGGEFVFNGKNVMVEKSVMKTLDIGQQVGNFVIDAWVDVLNFEEQSVVDARPRRLFCGTNMIVDWMLKDHKTDFETKFNAFDRKMHGAVYREAKLADLKSFDLVFFPILECSHYYLIVFDLKQLEMNVIDNRASAQKNTKLKDPEDYFSKHTSYKLKELFVRYLDCKGHPSADGIRYSNAKMLKLPWATSANGTDCGVFVMRHMEKFYGAREVFDCGLSSKGASKKNQIEALRKKFAKQIIMSNANMMKDEIMKIAGVV